MRMKKIITNLYIVIALVCALGCSSDPSSSQSAGGNSQIADQGQTKSRTGDTTIAAFLSGAVPDQAAAKAFERGMELATDAKPSPKINRTILDRSQGAVDSPALQPLLAKVPLVIYWQTADLAPAAQVLSQSEVIAVSVWNVTKKVAALGTKVFGFGYSTERSFAEYAKFAGNKLKSYRFAVLSSANEPFSTQSKAFIEESKSLGNTIVFEEKIDSASADFKELIARATKETCDTIFAVLPGDALVAFIKAARSASFTGKILVGDSFFSTEREALGKDAEGIYVLQAWSDDPTLKSQYSAKYASEPDGITLGAAALGYDLIQCLQAVGPNPNSESIPYSWLSTPCEGLTGKTLFSGERIAQRVKKVLTVKEDRFELVN